MLHLQNITAGYELPDGNQHLVLNDLNLTIRQGEFVALMGANGSGKTTLARLCNGLIQPIAGRVQVDEFVIQPGEQEHIPEIRRRVGMVFQNPENQIVSTTVEREIAFGLENLGLDPRQMHRRVQQALADFDLAHYRQHGPHRLSGGEKQRLVIAAVLAMQPRYLILDEPTALLDHGYQRKLMATIRSIHTGRFGTPCAILHITQYAAEALFAERLIILHEGKIYMDGVPLDIFLQENQLREIGLAPPVEFSAYLRLRKLHPAVQSVRQLLLQPIL